MQSFDDEVDSLSLVLLTHIFTCWMTNPYLSMTSLVSSHMIVRNAKSLVASG